MEKQAFFNCDSCGYNTRDISNYRKHCKTAKHLKKLKGESTKKTYTCDCGYSSQDKSNYNKHMKRHDEDRTVTFNYECIACDEKFETKYGMDRHGWTKAHRANVRAMFPDAVIEKMTGRFRIDLKQIHRYMKKHKTEGRIVREYKPKKQQEEQPKETYKAFTDKELEAFGQTYYPDMTDAKYHEVVTRLILTMEKRGLDWESCVSAVDEWKSNKMITSYYEETIVELLEEMKIETPMLE